MSSKRNQLKLMSVTLVVTTVLFATVLADNSQPDKQRLAGLWRVTSVHFGGRQLQSFGQWTYKFSDDSVVRTSDRWGSQRYRLELDEAASPKHMDMHLTGIAYRSIYRFEGEKLILCGSTLANGEGPSKFAAPEDERWALCVLERVDKKTTVD